MRPNYQGNSNPLILIPQIVIRKNLTVERIIPKITINTYFGMNFDQSIGAIIIPKMINGVDGIVLTINTLRDTEVEEIIVTTNMIVDRAIEEYGELTAYTFIDAYNRLMNEMMDGMTDFYGLKIVSKEECYRICKYKDDEKV